MRWDDVDIDFTWARSHSQNEYTYVIRPKSERGPKTVVGDFEILTVRKYDVREGEITYNDYMEAFEASFDLKNIGDVLDA